MSISSNAERTLASFQDDLGVLRRDLATLVGHVKDGAANGAGNVTAQLDDGAHRLYRNVAAGGNRSAKAVSKQIVDQPVAAVLIALGLGYLGGRFLSR